MLCWPKPPALILAGTACTAGSAMPYATTYNGIHSASKHVAVRDLIHKQPQTRTRAVG